MLEETYHTGSDCYAPGGERTPKRVYRTMSGERR